MTVRRSFLSILASLLLLVVPLVAHAETKVLTAEATYVMGDGESPSFAEAMVLQKAKQMALEQAGTYVESYTKVQNYQLTTEEIQTIAGGVLQVEVLEKTRTLVGDGLKFFVKIKTTVTTDKVAELAQRIKGKNVAEEYKKLQEDYVRLSKEIESWKQLLAKTPPGPERDAALDQIRDREKAFASLQNSEATLFLRLVSGEALVRQALDEKVEVDRLIQDIKDHGHVIEIGMASAYPVADPANGVVLSFPITVKASDTLLPAVSALAQRMGGSVRDLDRPLGQGWWLIGSERRKEAEGVVIRLSNEANMDRYFRAQISRLHVQLQLSYTDGKSGRCQWSDSYLNDRVLRLFPPLCQYEWDTSPLFN